MADDEQREAGELLPELPRVRDGVGYQHVERREVGSQAGRATVPEVVVRADDEPAQVQLARERRAVVVSIRLASGDVAQKLGTEKSARCAAGVVGMERRRQRTL